MNIYQKKKQKSTPLCSRYPEVSHTPTAVTLSQPNVTRLITFLWVEQDTHYSFVGLWPYCRALLPPYMSMCKEKNCY